MHRKLRCTCEQTPAEGATVGTKVRGSVTDAEEECEQLLRAFAQTQQLVCGSVWKQGGGRSARVKGLCLRAPQSRVSIVGAASCFCFLRAVGSGDAASVQQLMFGASAERRVASSSQNHPSDAERDGVRDRPSGPLARWNAEEVTESGETTPRSQKETKLKLVFCWFLTGSREVSHIWRQTVWLTCLAQRNGGRAGEKASDWFGADRKWSCSVFNV